MIVIGMCAQIASPVIQMCAVLDSTILHPTTCQDIRQISLDDSLSNHLWDELFGLMGWNNKCL
jgi:hypothetical protein